MDNSNILILRPSKIKMILLFLVCLVGTIIGCYMTKDALLNEKIDLLISIFVFVTSSIGLLISLVLNLPNSSYLKLTPKGFENCTLYKKYFINWKDVKEFKVHIFEFTSPRGTTSTQYMVGYDFVDDYYNITERNRKNQNTFGAHASFHDTFNKKPEELVQILNEWNSKYGK